MRFFKPSCCIALLLLVGTAEAREWSSLDGNYKLEGDVISFNDKTVVLKRTSGKLVAVQLAELSDADRKFVQSEEAQQATAKSAEEMQTWTSKDGMKVRGRVLAYGHKEMTVQRKLGKVLINDVAFTELDELHQRLILKIVGHLENQEIKDQRQLEAWARGLGANVKTYPLDGVLMELESGDQIAVPFFLFASEELAILEPGWNAWKNSENDAEAADRESLLVQSQAMHYQQDRQQRQQVELLKLTMMANATGLISIWEVGLQPNQGVYGRMTSVVVPAANSDIAAQMAMQQHPGFSVYGIRKVR
ncbi:SHD1 domain-containing protein [Novipirellula artificiosorum]|uniref:SLA1 homology domain-containing protein n=1 Tax=Novipirellula artificiosorum TaxID=2528016 RepID=A0A5C6E4W1_9BACT|nr:SHD1 domain-containing protein [Novipirellula artificiosorum]TWU42466.1 hypothetical protein Poly41_07630 [Novipirellula artificiosorum]